MNRYSLGGGSMPWSMHGEHRYFYQSVRINGRPTKRYVGRGVEGEDAAAAIDQRRQDRILDKERLAAEKQAYELALKPLHELEQMSNLLMRAIVQGNDRCYYSGEWRRQNGNHKRKQQD